MYLHRRKFIKNLSLATGVVFSIGAPTLSLFSQQQRKLKRVRPGDPLFPSENAWQDLNKLVDGNLIKIDSPVNVCRLDINGDACKEVLKELKNPYYIGDTPAFTQTTGWYKAWQSQPSVYVIEAQNTNHIAEGVKFAKAHNLRLVVKGGGHSYQGNSSSADSLLIWTRKMHKVETTDAFVPKGGEGKVSPQPAVTIEAGARWLEAYNQVSVKNGRYVQGGGCTTVGVAGFIQGGGFGSFSKHYGMGAAALLEAEVITANGKILTVNEYQYPDLFWALKGGGGGNFAIISKLTLRTRELAQTFGAVFGEIKATDDGSYKKLIQQFISFYKTKLFNPVWGEQVTFNADNKLKLNMLFFNLSKEDAANAWKDFTEWVSADPSYSFTSPLNFIVLPAQKFWDAEFLTKYASNVIAKDDRPNAPAGNIFWLQNREESGQYLWGYQSTWVSQNFLAENKIAILTDALFNASRHWSATLHFNKGLAGAPREEIVAAKNTSMNPAVTDAFALFIIAGQAEPAFEDINGLEPDYKTAKWGAQHIEDAMNAFVSKAGNPGAYVAESNYFEKNWQQSFWGSNYEKLLQVKKKYDPDELFFMYHGVGSEGWSNDGFTKSNG